MSGSQAKFEALQAPPDALEKGGTEILRASIVDGGLRISMLRAFDDPQMWGMFIADVTRHVARIYALEENVPEERTIERIRNLYDAEMDAPTDIGSTSAIS